MKISIEHIEERMFDYYEGNLSEQEKTDLLNLIHQYPEYEVEFTRWAQSYAHVDHSMPDYGLTKKLLKAPVIPAYLNRYTVGISVIVIIAGLFTYLYIDNAQVKNQSVEVVKISTPDSEKKQFTQILSGTTFKEGNSIKENKLKNDDIISQKTINKRTESAEIISDTLSLPTDLPKENKATIGVAEKVQKDSVYMVGKVAETNTKNQEKKKVKSKSKFTMKPSPDFIPTNPNF